MKIPRLQKFFGATPLETGDEAKTVLSFIIFIE
jgi:hypothetical protein